MNKPGLCSGAFDISAICLGWMSGGNKEHQRTQKDRVPGTFQDDCSIIKKLFPAKFRNNLRLIYIRLYIPPTISQANRTSAINMSSGEGSEPSLSPDLVEATTNGEECPTSPTTTECKALQRSLDEQNEAIYKIEHDAQELDRQNTDLRETLEEMNDLNARQQEEFDLQEEELHKIKAALHEEHAKNETNESYINAAEESNQRLQEENEKQADLLARCINEQKQLMNELGSRDRAIDDLQVSLQKTDQLTRRYEEVIASFRKEREGWGIERREKTVSEHNRLLRERLSRAIEMGENSEDMCLVARTRSSLHRLDLDIARGRIVGRRITGGPSVTLKLNNKEAREEARAICAPPDTEKEDAPGKQQAVRIRLPKPSGNAMASDSSISSEFGRMSIEVESEYSSGTGSELETASESEERIPEAAKCGPHRYKCRQHENQRGHKPYRQHKRAHQQHDRQRYAQRKTHWQNESQPHKRQQDQANQQHRSLLQRLADDSRGKLRSNERVSNVRENTRQVAQQFQHKPLYKREMDWEVTNARWLFTFSGSVSEPEASINQANSMAMLARKRPRTHISTNDINMVDIDEEITNLPAKRVEICSRCGRADQGTMGRIEANDFNSVNSSARNSTAECLVHKTQTNTAGVQTEQNVVAIQSNGVLEQLLAATPPEEPPAPSASRQTSNTQAGSKEVQSEQGLKKTSATGVQASCFSGSSKGIQTKGTAMLSKTAQTDPVYVGTPPTCSLPCPPTTRQKGRKTMRQTQTPRKLPANESATQQKCLKWEDMSSSFAACYGLPQDHPEPEGHPTAALQLESMEMWQGRWVPFFLALGLLMYIWYSTREEELWMKANKVPRSVLKELRDSHAQDGGWMGKLNYGLIQWLEIDRVARG